VVTHKIPSRCPSETLMLFQSKELLHLFEANENVSRLLLKISEILGYLSGGIYSNSSTVRDPGVGLTSALAVIFLAEDSRVL